MPHRYKVREIAQQSGLSEAAVDRVLNQRSGVLHNDLRADARLAMRLILHERGALPLEPSRPVPIQVITPYNLPR